MRIECDLTWWRKNSA